ncbi:hypothetical protein KYY02_31170 [Streptomyces pimonensis]|uniref:Uncharacterized protein n=1 Tax=Streptomyces pimonensis TaxID=2860288 RepID=A0ABV4J7N6_9ACTN
MTGPDTETEMVAFLPFGLRARGFAEQRAAQALGSGARCPHPGPVFLSAIDPDRGAFCPLCAHAPMADLLLSPWCAIPQCTALAAPALYVLGPDVRYGLLAKFCEDCRTADTPHPATAPEGAPDG